MRKSKTKKSVAKRFTVTKKKKFLRSKAGKRHLLSCKKTKRKRHLRSKAVAASADMKLLRRTMPYA